MQISKRNTGKRKIAIILATLITLAAVAIATAVLAKIGPFEPKDNGTDTHVNLDKPSDEQVKAGEAIKKDSVNSGDKGASSGSDSSTPPSPSSSGNTTDVTMNITAANQDSDTLYIRTLIQLVTSSGSCQIKMNGPNGKTYSATSNVQAVSSSSTCEGFNIPTSNLSAGNWTINVTFSNGSYSAATSKEVTIK